MNDEFCARRIVDLYISAKIRAILAPFMASIEWCSHLDNQGILHDG